MTLKPFPGKGKEGILKGRKIKMLIEYLCINFVKLRTFSPLLLKMILD